MADPKGPTQNVRGPILLLFALIWALGTFGWQRTQPNGLPDAIYRGLQLFSLNFDLDPAVEMSASLHVARFLAPLFTVLAITTALSAQLRLNLRALRFRRRQQFAVIGYGALGRAVAEQIRNRRPTARIVAIDHSVSAGDCRAAYRRGIDLIEADALDARLLSTFAIGLHRSCEVMVACGSDETNLAVLDVVVRSGGKKRIWVHLSAHALASRIRDTYAPTAASGATIEFFEQAESLAQAMLLECPLVPLAIAAGEKAVHVVIHGFDQFGWLAAEQVLLNAIFPAPTFARPLVSVVTPDADGARATWQARHGHLDETLEVEFFGNPHAAISWSQASDRILGAVEARGAPTAHYFVGAVPGDLLGAALGLREGMQRGARLVAPIMIRADQLPFDATDIATSSGVLQLRIAAIDAGHATALMCGVADASLERRARAMHAAYQQGRTGKDFYELPHTLRLSNRRAAFHFLQKLWALGFEDAGLGSDSFEVGPGGLDWLQRLDESRKADLDTLEHARWQIDRLLEGWRPGPRNEEKRLREQLGVGLADYRELDPAERSKDRSQLADFLVMARAAGPAAEPAGRIEDHVWEGALPQWTDDGRTLLPPDGFEWSRLQCGEGAALRLRVIVPRQPGGSANDDAHREHLRNALRTFGDLLLTDAPSLARLRFVRPAGGAWDWLPFDPGGRVDGVTLPRFSVGFTGHRDLSRLGDLNALDHQLRADARSIVPEGGAPLVVGLADGADRMMLATWRELALGPVIGIAPFLIDGRPAYDNSLDCLVPASVLEACNEVIGPFGERDEDRHHLAGRALIDRCTLLIAVSDGENGGAGGTEALVAEARRQKMLVRYLRVPA